MRVGTHVLALHGNALCPGVIVRVPDPHSSNPAHRKRGLIRLNDGTEFESSLHPDFVTVDDRKDQP